MINVADRKPSARETPAHELRAQMDRSATLMRDEVTTLYMAVRKLAELAAAAHCAQACELAAAAGRSFGDLMAECHRMETEAGRLSDGDVV